MDGKSAPESTARIGAEAIAATVDDSGSGGGAGFAGRGIQLCPHPAQRKLRPRSLVSGTSYSIWHEGQLIRIGALWVRVLK